MKYIQTENWKKWLAVSFPIIASLLITFIDFISFDIFSVTLQPQTHELISMLIYSFSVLFGVNSIRNFTETKPKENNVNTNNDPKV